MTAPSTPDTATKPGSGLPAISSYRLPTRLPESKVSWPLDPQRSVLLVHDMQRHFIAPFPGAEEPLSTAIANMVRLRAAANAAGVPVVYTCQPPDQSPEHRALLTDFWGPGLRTEDAAAVTTELTPSEGDRVLTKWRYSAFQRTELLELMQNWGRNQLMITGVYAHIGCLATSLEAFAHDIQAFLVADAVADFNEQYHHDALNYVAARCGRVLTAGQVLAELATGNCALPMLSIDELHHRVADLLGDPVEDVGVEENLFDLGLDSVRVMLLVEQLRGEGVDVAYPELAAEPTVRAWHLLLGSGAGR